MQGTPPAGGAAGIFVHEEKGEDRPPTLCRFTSRGICNFARSRQGAENTETQHIHKWVGDVLQLWRVLITCNTETWQGNNTRESRGVGAMMWESFLKLNSPDSVKNSTFLPGSSFPPCPERAPSKIRHSIFGTTTRSFDASYSKNPPGTAETASTDPLVTIHLVEPPQLGCQPPLIFVRFPAAPYAS